MTARPRLPTASSVVVLDLDDTLYLERDYQRSGFRAVGAWLEGELGVPDFCARATAQFDRGRRTQVFDTVLTELGIAISPELIATLVQVFREHRPVIELQPDAAQFLDRPRKDRALAVLTDGFLVAQRNKIRALGLDRRGLWPIICTDAWGRRYWKPHTRGFRHIQAQYRLPGHACLYVADNPAKDFVAPRRLGWRSVRIKRPDGVHLAAPALPDHAADFEIETFAELTEARLDEMLAAPTSRAA